MRGICRGEKMISVGRRKRWMKRGGRSRRGKWLLSKGKESSSRKSKRLSLEKMRPNMTIKEKSLRLPLILIRLRWIILRMSDLSEIK
jgi:hypothetical protein